MSEALSWDPLPESVETGPSFTVSNPTAFADANDLSIQRNDWPYGVFGGEVTYLTVWLKSRISTDPERGLMANEPKALAEEFVNRTFVERLNEEGLEAETRVLWFKNWTALQSVKGLEYIHVLVRNVPDKVVAQWTGEVIDVPWHAENLSRIS